MADLNLIPKTKEKGSSVPSFISENVFLVFGFLLFLATVSLWGGLILYRNTIQDEIQAKQQGIEKLQSDIRTAGDIETKLRNLNLRLYSLETLLDEHPYPSRLFVFLEKNYPPPGEVFSI